MSAKDEDDDFFADIYGEDGDKSTQKAGETAPASGAGEAKAIAEPVKGEANAPRSSDPRLAFLDNPNDSDSTAAAAAADPVPATAPTAAAAPATGMPQIPGMPAGFDPATLSQQLQQFQKLQEAAGSSSGGDSQPDGFHAGKIFIPAKDEGKMFIGGLNWETTDESMKNYFSQFGEVTEATVMRDPMSGRSRGFGFLTFRDAKVVGVVLAKEHFLDGKIIDPKRAIPREEQDKTAKIFVGGVGGDVTEDDFKTFFEQYGTVIDAQLMIDKDTGRPRGFGFVTFDSSNAVDTIVAEQFLNLKGKPIEVKRAEPRGREARDSNRNGGGYNNMAPQQAGMYNGMDPAMMTQYYQQWQTYMAKMQEMMQQGGGAAAAGGNNPLMQMYQQMAAQQGGAGMPSMMPGGMPGMPNPQQDAGSGQDDFRDRRRDYRRGNDDRRRSRSPGAGYRRRRDPRGDPRDRDRDRDRGDRDRHYNR